MYHPWDNSTIFYQQDKGGGIIPTAEGARLRISRLRGGAAKCRPAVLFFRPLLAF